eukprot:Gb_18909 [translate_table: standard]
MFDVGSKENIELAIAKFFYACGIPFNVAQSPYYEEMVCAINNGPKGFKPPGYEKLYTTLIDKKKSQVDKELELVQSEWPMVGGSIIMDGWTDRRNRPFINIIVSCLRGPYFFRAINCSLQEKNVIFQHIYWMPYFVHAMNNVLEDFGKFSWISPIIEKGREIQMFVCNHHLAQTMYLLHAKVELLKPVNIRYGTYFILLR